MENIAFPDLDKVKGFLMITSLAVLAAVLGDQIILSFAHKAAETPDSQKFIKQFAPEKLSPLDPLPAYLGPIEMRDLFNVSAKAPVNSGRQTLLLDFIKDLRLTGIARFEKPEAILEDAGKRGSVFVREGEKIGSITVKKIKQDSIVVGMGDESAEIKIKKGESGGL